MNRFFPELVAMLQERKDGPFVADGEIVLAIRPGRSRSTSSSCGCIRASRVRMLSEEIPATLMLSSTSSRSSSEDLTGRPLVEPARRLGRSSAPEPHASVRRRRTSTILEPGALDLLTTAGRGPRGRRREWFADEAARPGRPHRQAPTTAVTGARGVVEGQASEDRGLRRRRVPRRQERRRRGSLLLGCTTTTSRFPTSRAHVVFKAKERRELRERLDRLDGAK